MSELFQTRFDPGHTNSVNGTATDNVNLAYPRLHVSVSWHLQIFVLCLGLILSKITSFDKVLEIIFQMLTVLCKMTVITMKITSLSLVPIFMKHLLGTLPFVAIFVQGIYLCHGCCQLGVLIKPFLPIAFFTVTAFLDHIRLFSFISAAVSIAAFVFHLPIFLPPLRLTMAHGLIKLFSPYKVIEITSERRPFFQSRHQSHHGHILLQSRNRDRFNIETINKVSQAFIFPLLNG